MLASSGVWCAGGLVRADEEEEECSRGAAAAAAAAAGRGEGEWEGGGGNKATGKEEAVERIENVDVCSERV